MPTEQKPITEWYKTYSTILYERAFGIAVCWDLRVRWVLCKLEYHGALIIRKTQLRHWVPWHIRDKCDVRLAEL